VSDRNAEWGKEATDAGVDPQPHSECVHDRPRPGNRLETLHGSAETHRVYGSEWPL
jgi:hypothetical protein